MDGDPCEILTWKPGKRAGSIVGRFFKPAGMIVSKFLASFVDAVDPAGLENRPTIEPARRGDVSFASALDGDEDADVGFLVDGAEERRPGFVGGRELAEPEPAGRDGIIGDRLRSGTLRGDAADEDR